MFIVVDIILEVLVYLHNLTAQRAPDCSVRTDSDDYHDNVSDDMKQLSKFSRGD